MFINFQFTSNKFIPYIQWCTYVHARMASCRRVSQLLIYAFKLTRSCNTKNWRPQAFKNPRKYEVTLVIISTQEIANIT
jgi:hypothetical protein